MLTASQKAEFMTLLKKYQQHKASPAEIEFLENYYRYFDQEEKQSLQLSSVEIELLESRIYQNIERIIQVEERPLSGRSRPILLLWQKIAASIIFILLSGIGIYLFHNRSTASSLAKSANKSERFKNDLAPGGNKAILILADGSHISLDSAENGKLTNQGNAKILKFNNGTLAYQTISLAGKVKSSEEIKYNTVSTPKGGQYQIILADGSKVWLNAASSLRFPASFQGKDREVELTGEAYFEIAKLTRPLSEKSKTGKVPFTVRVNGIQVEVTGTHFNINAYDDENSVKTTLLEGSVKVKLGNAITVLRPGNQSEIDRNGNMKFIQESNVEDVVAWKNGMFQFRSANIESIMRQIARWYDVDIEYSQKLDEKFYAEIPRNTRATELFKILETTGAVHFEIDGKKVKVKP
jgi:transmembrane sensor